MRHNFISGVLYAALVGFVAVAALAMLNYSGAPRAQAVLGIPYGGWVVSQAVPFIPNPLCTNYVIVKNADPLSLVPTFGLYIPPWGIALLYDYKNLFTPGVPLLGEYDSIPNAACGLTPTGGKVYPIDFNGLFYFTGTGAF